MEILRKQTIDILKKVKETISLDGLSESAINKKIEIIRNLKNLENYMEENSLWIIPPTISSLQIQFNELLVEEQSTQETLNSYYQEFEDLASSIGNKIVLKENTNEEIFKEFLSYPKSDQIEFLKDPENKDIIEFFIPFLSQIEDKETVILILEDLFKDSLEYREPYISAIKNNFYAQGVLASKTNDPNFVFDLLSLQDINVENIFINRSRSNNLSINLFEFWGFLSSESRMFLVQEKLENIDQFSLIARSLALHLKEENYLLWLEISKKDFFKEIIQYLKESSLFEDCVDKWPNLFLNK